MSPGYQRSRRNLQLLVSKNKTTGGLMDLDLCDFILAIQFVVTTQSVFLCSQKKIKLNLKKTLTVFVLRSVEFN